MTTDDPARLKLAIQNLETALALAEQEIAEWKRRAVEGVQPEHVQDAVAIVAWQALCQMVRSSAWVTLTYQTAALGHTGRSWVVAVNENDGRTRLSESMTLEEAIGSLVKTRRENP